MDSLFRQSVIDIIKAIPSGSFLSYKEVSIMAGAPRGSRQVSWILHRDSEKFDLPWHRVINASYKISLPDERGELQKALLIAEGCSILKSGRVQKKGS